MNVAAVKKYLIAASVGAGITAAAFVLFNALRPPDIGARIIVTNFSVVTNYADRIPDVNPGEYPPVCRDLVLRFNNLNTKYMAYAFGIPTYLSNAGQCVDFQLAATVYRMCYRVDLPPERAHWNIGGGYFARGGIAVTGGVDWTFLSGSAVILTGLPGAWNPDIGGIVSFRAPF